jgi:hypothetical protein
VVRHVLVGLQMEFRELTSKAHSLCATSCILCVLCDLIFSYINTMRTREEKSIAKEPSFSYGGKYSYADYLSWEMDEMVEIIKGKVFKWTAAPSRTHQEVAGNIFFVLKGFQKGKACKIFQAPFDVRLPSKSNKNEEIFTVVQPDLCVICDKSKLDEAGC